MPSHYLLCLLLNCFFLQYGDSRQISQDCSKILCKPCSEWRQQQVQTPQNECCGPCLPQCTCPKFLEEDCILEGYKDLTLPVGKSVYKDFGTQKCTCVSASNIVSASTCPKIRPKCKHIEKPLDGCSLCACPTKHGSFVPAGETMENECKVCKGPPEGGELQCTLTSKSVKCKV